MFGVSLQEIAGGWTPLHYAACVGYLSVCKELLGRMKGRLNPEVRCAVYVSSELEFSFLKDHLDVVQLFVESMGYVCFSDEWQARILAW